MEYKYAIGDGDRVISNTGNDQMNHTLQENSVRIDTSKFTDSVRIDRKNVQIDRKLTQKRPN